MLVAAADCLGLMSSRGLYMDHKPIFMGFLWAPRTPNCGSVPILELHGTWGPPSFTSSGQVLTCSLGIHLETSYHTSDGHSDSTSARCPESGGKVFSFCSHSEAALVTPCFFKAGNSFSSPWEHRASGCTPLTGRYEISCPKPSALIYY